MISTIIATIIIITITPNATGRVADHQSGRPSLCIPPSPPDYLLPQNPLLHHYSWEGIFSKKCE